MSWEGYGQYICAKGHFYTGPVDIDPKCSCGSGAVWANVVDETNCDSYGEIPFELLVERCQVAPDVIEICPHCQNKKIIEMARFRIPTEEERQAMRHYRPGYGGTPLKPIPRDRLTD